MDTDKRINLRLNMAEKAMLTSAAATRGLTVKQFVLQASLNAAQEVLALEGHWQFDSHEYQWLCDLMDAPARDLPELRTLIQRKPVWSD